MVSNSAINTNTFQDTAQIYTKDFMFYVAQLRLFSRVCKVCILISKLLLIELS